jgi:hypothetical protein
MLSNINKVEQDFKDFYKELIALRDDFDNTNRELVEWKKDFENIGSQLKMDVQA